MTPSDQPARVAVAGGGISGLTAAYRLQKAGYEVLLFEKNGYPGGAIKSDREEGWLVEKGPNTLMAGGSRLWELIEELELETEVVRPGKEASRRYIVKGGTPHPLPDSLGSFIRSGLLSFPAKLRLFKEPFIAPSDSEQPESIASFFERRLGPEVVDYAVNPFVAGIYAGDPESLSVAHTLSKVFELEQQYGSIVKGAVKSPRKKRSDTGRPRGLISFRNGIQQLTNRIREALGSSVRCNTPVQRIAREDTGWTVSADGKQYAADTVLYTAPLHAIPTIRFEVERPELLDQLSTMRYAPLAAVALGFRKQDIGHPLDGFGVLVPEVESSNILGCLFSSTLFEGRAPESHELLTCFIGGERSPEQASRPDAELIQLAVEDLKHLLNVSGSPVYTAISRWDRAIPQYRLNHQTYLDAMDRLEQKNPGLYFTGNFRKEVSVPGCIEQAYETSERIASFL